MHTKFALITFSLKNTHAFRVKFLRVSNSIELIGGFYKSYFRINLNFKNNIHTNFKFYIFNIDCPNLFYIKEK